MISIENNEYRELLQTETKYLFLISILLKESRVSDKGKLDFTYNADTMFEAFMETMEKELLEGFIENHKEVEE